ncbi:hypothetical protein E4634_19750 [Mangrovimicrobium sediminis]|uniref:Aminoglycoside phosphotransferase domain-containing protein n=1 Tax=Mangrovimicrobium sediminis TaxID=2562682 RepID=A0A4Z0LUU1_9GAMM|nr:hypothetical protein [Haliea sp. SAOS-164]TGD71082.1 hypothetical protein E4634_19750 [Haliea sp. SAOS-164]
MHWVRGEQFGIDIPADAETLLAGGAGFLTRAFRAAGSLSADNAVTAIDSARPFSGGGTGHKLLLDVTYASPDTSLPTRLFVKFSRNFEDELRDSARFMMLSETRFAVLSRAPGFPVAVPLCLFADVEPESCSGLTITECLDFGNNGLEPHYPKCMDYLVPDPLAHYRAIVTALGRLAGTHRAGGLPPEFDRYFVYNAEQAAAALQVRSPLEKLLPRAQRMFDFIDRYPQLFPENIRDRAFQQQFTDDIPRVVAAQDGIRAVLGGNPDFIALCHWNANIDNCWFWRDAEGELRCGMLDWAMVGPMSVAQSISGALSGAEQFIWNDHLDEIIGVFIESYAAHGGPRLQVEEVRTHLLLLLALAGVSYFMSAPLAIQREIEDLDALESYRDVAFQQHENARIQLHMMTKMLNVWQTRDLGKLVTTIGG